MKYGQKVRVTSGFYEGMEGTLKRENIFFTYPNSVSNKESIISYTMMINGNESGWFPESSLELI